MAPPSLNVKINKQMLMSNRRFFLLSSFRTVFVGSNISESVHVDVNMPCRLASLCGILSI